MTKKITTILIAVLFLGTMMAGDALAGKGQQKGNTGKSTTVQTNKGQNNGVCPFGNTPGTGKAKATAAGKTKGFGPGDGSGNGTERAKDGTGYGAVKQDKGKTNNSTCDGTGPKGTSKRKGQDG